MAACVSSLCPLRRAGATWLATCACFASLVVGSEPLRADCTSSGVHVNQVRYHDTRVPDGGTARLDAFVELFNKGSAAATLGGWQITDEHRANLALLPATLSLPSGAFLEVVMGSGSDDLDFSDGVGTLYTNGDSIEVFSPAGGGAALYDDTGAIRDYVSWSETGSAPTGTAANEAASAGIWASSAFVPGTADQALFTIRLAPDGFDHDLPSDWVQSGWGDSNFGALDAGPNALQLDPVDGAGLGPGSVTLLWQPVAAATAYHLRVLDGAGGTELDQTITTTSATLSLPGGLHRWSVRVVDACGESAAENFWRFTLFPIPLEAAAGPSGGSRPGIKPDPGPAPLAPDAGPSTMRLGVPQEYQRKDTRLICDFSIEPDVCCPAESWPGCTETPGDQGPWDNAHPTDHAERLVNQQWIQCRHCSNYCARASTRMINVYYGGNLSQDRLSYEQILLGDREHASPEGDLAGHGNRSSWELGGQVLQWAILNSVVNGPMDPDYVAIRAEIQTGYPVRTTYRSKNVIGTHAVVIDGYADANLLGPGIPPENMLHVVNPWPTSHGVGPGGWLGYASIPIGKWWQLRPAGVQPLAGRVQEPGVTTDTDGDGAMDFDEGDSGFGGHGPRAFQSRGDRADTDGDQVADKQEIRSYAFHASDHPTHPVANPNLLRYIGPDPDHDGVRAERDPDSDDDGDFDGGEDVNGNGRSPEAGETCVYDFNSTLSKLVPPSGTVAPGSPAILAGINFHAVVGYTYYVYRGCPLTMPPGTPYAGFLSAGSVVSDAAGGFQITLTGLDEGCYAVAIDVLNDGLFGDLIPIPGGSISEVLDQVASFSVGVTDVAGALPSRLDMAVARNPARGAVELAVSLPAAGPVRLAVYDAGGRCVRTLLDAVEPAGVTRTVWNGLSASGAPLPSGIYFARLRAGGASVVRTLVRLE